MGLLVVLPSERELLSDRSIFQLLDSDVFNYLSERTDWSTGRIGSESAVSYSRMSSDLSESIERRTNVKYTRKHIENSVARLVNNGLFKRESISGSVNRLILVRIFWFDMVLMGKSAQNPDGRQMGGLMGELSKYLSFNNNTLEKNPESRWEGQINPDGTSNSIYISNADEELFSMNLEWDPDRQFIEKILQANGYDNSKVKKVWFGNYKTFWSGRQTRKTQKDWEYHFAKKMMHYLANPGLFDRLNGISQGVTPLSKSQGDDKAVKRLVVPNLNDGSQLQAWALSKGLAPSSSGLSTQQYRKKLVNDVERLNMSVERRH